MEQWHIDNAVAILQESRGRMAKALEDNGVDVLDYNTLAKDINSYSLGCVRALDLGITVIEGMSKHTAPQKRTLREDVISLTSQIRDDAANMIENVAWWIRSLGE